MRINPNNQYFHARVRDDKMLNSILTSDNSYFQSVTEFRCLSLIIQSDKVFKCNLKSGISSFYKAFNGMLVRTGRAASPETNLSYDILTFANSAVCIRGVTSNLPLNATDEAKLNVPLT